MSSDAKPHGLWSRARAMAEQTPPERNRYVDFLRALSIMVALPFVGAALVGFGPVHRVAKRLA